MTAFAQNGSIRSKGCSKNVSHPHYYYLTAAVLAVIFQRSSEETRIVTELVHLKETQRSIGPGPATDHVRGGVWGMLYADDACKVSFLRRGPAKMMGGIEKARRAFVLTVSERKNRYRVHASIAFTADDDWSRAAGESYKHMLSLTTCGAPLPSRTWTLKSPGGPAHAERTPGDTYMTSYTTSQKWRSPFLCMDVVRGPFPKNTTPNSAPYTTGTCLASSGHIARDQITA